MIVVLIAAAVLAGALGELADTIAIVVIVEKFSSDAARRVAGRAARHLCYDCPVALTGLRLALFADIHANREALAACLAHSRQQGYDRAVFLGDLVGYCADPCWVLDELAVRAGRGDIVLLGNHDEAVVRGPRATMHPDAAQVASWTRGRLDRAQLAFLAGLRLKVEDADLLFVHANAWAPRRWEYLTSAAAAGRSLAATGSRCTFFGHVHAPALYHQGATGRIGVFTPGPGVSIPLGPRRRWVVNPGSVGQPRDGIPAACYAIYDGPKRLLEYHRVPYDAAATARKIGAAGLPAGCGVRLGVGA